MYVFMFYVFLLEVQNPIDDDNYPSVYWNMDRFDFGDFPSHKPPFSSRIFQRPAMFDFQV